MTMEASKTTRSTPSKTTKSGESETPEYDAALEVGYLGVATDTRDNDEYTVAGSTARAEEGPPDVSVEADPLHAQASR
jgi:hypothetical protein